MAFTDNDKEYFKANELQEQGYYAQALPILQKLAQQQYSGAFNTLGIMYKMGEGVAINYNKAISLYKKAWRIDKDTCAYYNLIDLYFKLNKPRIALYWLKKRLDTDDEIKFIYAKYKLTLQRYNKQKIIALLIKTEIYFYFNYKLTS